jgi:hypothetical protein
VEGIAHKKSGHIEWERERPSFFARALFLSNAFRRPDARLQSRSFATLEFLSRSHDAAIRVYDKACNVIETNEHAGEFKAP